jgi:hypothetical protein
MCFLSTALAKVTACKCSVCDSKQLLNFGALPQRIDYPAEHVCATDE